MIRDHWDHGASKEPVTPLLIHYDSAKSVLCFASMFFFFLVTVLCPVDYLID